jgi:hypothetical protein
MKKVILQSSPAEITVEEASHNCFSGGTDNPVLFAYKSEGKSGWCFLTKIALGRYGFVAMNYTDTNPRFVAGSMQAALASAVRSRTVYAFNGVKELVTAIINNY